MPPCMQAAGQCNPHRAFTKVYLLFGHTQLDGFIGSKHGGTAWHLPEKGGHQALVQPSDTPL